MEGLTFEELFGKDFWNSLQDEEIIDFDFEYPDPRAEKEKQYRRKLRKLAE